MLHSSRHEEALIKKSALHTPKSPPVASQALTTPQGASQSKALRKIRESSPTRQRLGLRQSSGAFQPHDPDRRFCRGLFNNLTFHTPHSEICCFRFPLSAFDGSQSGSDPVRLGPPRFVFRRRRLVRRLVAPACPPPL